MSHTVLVQPPAHRDIERAYRWMRRELGPERATSWRVGLLDAMRSLESMPERCGTAPEGAGLTPAVRQLLFESYRILFTVVGREVRVVHVRHAARGPWKR